MSQPWGAAVSVVIGVAVGFLTNLLASISRCPMVALALHSRVGLAHIHPSFKIGGGYGDVGNLRDS